MTKKVFIVCTLLFIFKMTTAQTQAPAAPVAQEADSLFELVEVKSYIFNNRRTLRVLLPPGYYNVQNSTKRYPVLYMNDGFSFFKTWKVKETSRQLMNDKLIEEIIIIGIDNAISNKHSNPDLRTNEYLPYPEKTEPTVPYPQGKLYPNFLEKEILPLINSKYRSLQGAKHTVIGGSSYGGYIAFYCYLKKPNLFGGVLCESTPFFISNEKMTKEAEKFKKWQGKIAIGLGSAETPDSSVNLSGRKAQDVLVNIIKKQERKVKLNVLIKEGASHGAKSWAERFPEQLKFLYELKFRNRPR